MAYLSESLSVSRPSGGPLELNAGVYSVVDFPPPEEVWETTEAESPYVHGSDTVAAKLVSLNLRIVIRIDAGDWVAHMAAYRAMRAAFAQHSYTTTHVYEGETTEFTKCKRYSKIAARQAVESDFEQAHTDTKAGIGEYVVMIRCYPLIPEVLT